MLHGLRPSAHDRDAAPRRRALALTLATGVLAASTFAAAGPAAATDKRDPYGKTYSVGAYVYKKLRPADGAAWTNSGQQFLVGTWDGREYRPTMTLAEIQAVVDFPICGAGWGMQQDKAYGGPEVFTEATQQPKFPDFVIGWESVKGRYEAGTLYNAAHWNLETVVGAVPPCSPAATPTPTPVVTPTPVPSATPDVTPTPTPSEEPTPEASVAPTAAPSPTSEVSAAPTPTATPSPTPTPTVPGASEVLAAAPTPTPSPSFTSEVLAATPPSGRVLAATGSSVGPMLAIAGVLVAGGAGLVVARQRRARQQG